MALAFAATAFASPVSARDGGVWLVAQRMADAELAARAQASAPDRAALARLMEARDRLAASRHIQGGRISTAQAERLLRGMGTSPS